MPETRSEGNKDSERKTNRERSPKQPHSYGAEGDYLKPENIHPTNFLLKIFGRILIKRWSARAFRTLKKFHIKFKLQLHFIKTTLHSGKIMTESIGHRARKYFNLTKLWRISKRDVSSLEFGWCVRSLDRGYCVRGWDLSAYLLIPRNL